MTTDGLPPFWPTRRLGELLARPLAYGVLKPGAYVPGGVPLVRIQDVHTGYLDAEKMHKISPVLHEEFRRTKLVGGEILLSIVGTIGKVVEVPRSLSGANISRALCVLGPSAEIERRFLRYVLTSIRVQDWVLKEGRGNAQAVLNLGLLRELTVQVPPLPEQRKIAAILSAVDEAIEGTQAVIDQLQVVKKAMMAELLTRGLPNRHTRFKHTEIGVIPESWEVVRLGDLAVRVTKGTTPPTGGEKYSESGIPFVRVENIGAHGDLILDGVKYVSRATHETLARSQLRANDVLFSIAGALGRVAVVPSWMVEANTNQAVSLIRLHEPLDAAYLSWALRSPPVEGQISLQRAALAQANLSLEQVGKLRIAWPPPEERSRLTQVLTSCVNSMASESAVLNEFRLLKSALMSVLLTGELRVTPDEATP